MTKYLHSKTLDLPIKLNTETGTITVNDLKKFGTKGHVTYSREEVNLLSEVGGVTPEIHLAKNIFNGRIVK